MSETPFDCCDLLAAAQQGPDLAALDAYAACEGMVRVYPPPGGWVAADSISPSSEGAIGRPFDSGAPGQSSEEVTP